MAFFAPRLAGAFFTAVFFAAAAVGFFLGLPIIISSFSLISYSY
jgi:hypothetical protein